MSPILHFWEMSGFDPSELPLQQALYQLCHPSPYVSTHLPKLPITSMETKSIITECLVPKFSAEFPRNKQKLRRHETRKESDGPQLKAMTLSWNMVAIISCCENAKEQFLLCCVNLIWNNFFVKPGVCEKFLWLQLKYVAVVSCCKNAKEQFLPCCQSNMELFGKNQVVARSCFDFQLKYVAIVSCFQKWKRAVFTRCVNLTWNYF